MLDNPFDGLKSVDKITQSAARGLDLSMIDPLLRDVIEQTNHSRWLRTEFSCSGLPADHARDSDGIALKRSRSLPPASALPSVSAVRKVGLPLTERLSKLRLTERPKKSMIRKTLDQTEAASAISGAALPTQPLEQPHATRVISGTVG
jgi:hypothetical protein